MEELTKEITKTEERQPEQQAEQTSKTFTQEEVNRIVSDRLARDREKRAAELDEREKAVKARELAVLAVEKLAAAGLPKELSDVLKYDDEASLEGAIERLSSMKGFKPGNNAQSGGRKVFIENKLPEPSEYDGGDYAIRDAFRFHKE